MIHNGLFRHILAIFIAVSVPKGRSAALRLVDVDNAMPALPRVSIPCRDNLFLPSLLEAAGNGQLRVFGNGMNKVSFTYLDNYCHGLILGYDALYKVTLPSFLCELEGQLEYVQLPDDALEHVEKRVGCHADWVATARHCWLFVDRSLRGLILCRFPFAVYYLTHSVKCLSIASTFLMCRDRRPWESFTS